MPKLSSFLSDPAISLPSLWALSTCTMILLLSLTVITWISLTDQHSTPRASSIERLSECPEAADSRTRTPKFLNGIIPDVVESFVVLDVEGTNGELKLVAWCQPIDTSTGNFGDARFEHRSRVELVSVKPGQKATSICHAFGDGLYNPRILRIRNCNYHGHQVFVLLRNEGAACELAKPFWIEHDCLDALPSLGAEQFEIKELAGPESGLQQHLISHSRIVGSSDMPCIYDWSGDQFVVNNDSHPDYYNALANENKCLYTDKDAGPCDLYGEAVFLKRAGRGKEALEALDKIHKDVEHSSIPELIYGSADLLDKLGQRKKSLSQTLALYRLLETRKHAADPYNPDKGNYLNYVNPELAYECSVLLGKFGKEKEARQLLKDVGNDVEHSDEPDLISKYHHVTASLQRRR